jgi:carbamoyltransferase
MPLILGINAYHGDSSACILRDGVLLAAVEEERLNRVKHWSGFPLESIKYCLEEAKCTIKDIDFIAINQNSKAHLWKKFIYIFTKNIDLILIFRRLFNRKKREVVEKTILRDFKEKNIKAKFVFVEHHIAHLYSAHSVSPFKTSIALSVDGFGDFCSTAWGICKESKIDVIDRVYFPHSLGILYQALTQYLGFKNYGDEYKVMGLAPYGEANYVKEICNLINLKDDGKFTLNLDYFNHHRSNIQFEMASGIPSFKNLYSDKIFALLGPGRAENEPIEQKHKDIAHSLQVIYEKAFFNLLNILHRKYKIDNLTLAGGCAMNSVANGKIYKNTPFKNVYIQSAPGDAGGAIGAAFYVQNTKIGINSKFIMNHSYWGPEYNPKYIDNVINSYRSDLKNYNITVSYENEISIPKKVAELIARGFVIGRFDGRMEWGPRALGNRSIIADPRRSDMKQILNVKIKKRESFRPFAPSILAEHVEEWFEEVHDVPFMTQVLQVKKEKRSQIPAVTHIDGSGRLQSVTSTTNLKFYKIIEEFFKLTGVPIVLNTSFNENEPIVCKPKEAIDCFIRTNMDALLLGNIIISRKSID